MNYLVVLQIKLGMISQILLPDNFTIIGKLLGEYGDVVRVWIGPSMICINKKPKDIEVITL